MSLHGMKQTPVTSLKPWKNYRVIVRLLRILRPR